MRTPPWPGVAMGLPQVSGVIARAAPAPSCLPGQFVPTEAPDGPGRAGRALTGRLSGLAARQDASGLLVSYRPLASHNPS